MVLRKLGIVSLTEILFAHKPRRICAGHYKCGSFFCVLLCQYLAFVVQPKALNYVITKSGDPHTTKLSRETAGLCWEGRRETVGF